MEISQLRTIIHVAELGSLSKAADRMRIAQPALSRQVRMLEQELGISLFTRHGRGMVLTEAGRDVVKRAMYIMTELEEIRANTGHVDAPLTGQVAVGLPPTVSGLIEVPLMASLQARHPQAMLRIVSAYTGYLIDWLHRGEVDIAVLYAPVTAQALRSEPLLVEKFFVIGPPDSGFDISTPVPFDHLNGKRMVLPSIRHGLRPIIEKCASVVGISLNVIAEADSYTSLKNLVQHGHGWTILPLASIYNEVRSGFLSAAPLSEPVALRQLVLSYPSDRPTSRLAHFVGTTIHDIVNSYVEQGIWDKNSSLP
ncbi:LysR substrate-binding domain-containing protein [Komagataeibacter sp. FNDCF1]|uniref:LysR family transcriptional regulator n=1 Tax=Komagataeibacter sp. FNDCF1 TaxID=2878681 RepID=UPI001E60F1ED|nr:LysR substrate-binding domain-containing protein [Komagataeibacter sp. FNDCF1]MCE2563295.1 LysR family transcriptional regulator [Komagataeibacter sp. FNDCF1]